jgi:multidrug efflux system membrane fusion protein
LYPGQFVNVVLTLGMDTQATVVPTQAVQVGQDKSFVYVAKADGTVEMRTVQTGTTTGTMTVIENGLKPGEQVVTDGQLRLVPGAKYQVRGQGQEGGRGQRGDQGGANQGQAGDQNQSGVPGQGGGQGGGRRGGGGQNPNP